MRLRKVPMVALLLTMAMAALPAVPAVAAADDPATVVRRFFEARNRYDVAGALALVTDDIRLVGGPRCTSANPCLGTSAFRAEMQDYIADHNQVTLVGAPQVSGMTVRARIEARTDLVRATGVDRAVLNLTVEVRDGRIANYLSVLDTSDAQTAQYLAYMRAQQGPPTAPPRTGGGGEASYIRRLGDG